MPDTHAELLAEVRSDVKVVRESVARLEERTAGVEAMRDALEAHKVADAQLHGALSESVSRLWWLAGGALSLGSVALGVALTKLLGG